VSDGIVPFNWSLHPSSELARNLALSNDKDIQLQPCRAPYGSWITPFTSQVITAETIGFGTIVIDRSDIYWIETRPAEGGRHVIVRRAADGTTSDITPRSYNARTRVHEYGGGAYTAHEGVVYFSNYTDQKLYRQNSGAFAESSTSASLCPPECLNTPAGMRFAEAVFDSGRNRLIAVCEEHFSSSDKVVNSIAAIALDGSGRVTKLAEGFDFYAMPKLSPGGEKLAWLCWKHPNMPWDGTELFVANFDEDGHLSAPTLIAGGADESVAQPEWSPDSELYFISDRNGWWNIHRQRNGAVESVHKRQSEFCRASWHLGYSSYAFAGSEQLICSYNQKGFWNIGLIDLKSKQLSEIKTEFTDVWWLKILGRKAIFRGASPSIPQAIIALDIDTGTYDSIAQSTNIVLDREMISEPEAIEFSSFEGESAYGFYYRPKNKHYRGPETEKPPLLVKVHGGPTGTALTMLNLEIQFWTSRGFAVLDVNYSGSAGYGRAYRERLAGTWGIRDVDDCISGALHLVAIGAVDVDRLLVSGGSAGGFTTLCALTFQNTFRAGASYYGVSDLEAMRRETHKFESHYFDKLIGPFPERRDIYVDRSPIHHIDKLCRPVAFFQGKEDKIVPPNQTEIMVDALRRKNIPVACLIFENEQHAFRRGETIRRCLDGELYFYSKVLGFKAPDDILPLEIANLPHSTVG
jgi:dipeptidyl aminopeptidase/acylaminoacyl peptidase